LDVAGELDLSTVSKLEAAVYRLIPDGREVVIDLRRISFLDSTGLRSILLCERHCNRHSCKLAIRVSAGLLRLFESYGIHQRLPIVNGQ
jgi:anti-anti-sigma factor